MQQNNVILVVNYKAIQFPKAIYLPHSDTMFICFQKIFLLKEEDTI